MDFSRETLRMGLKNQEAAEETPETFATLGGADSVKGTNGKRKAGEVGAFALELMNDPNAVAVNQAWMTKFGLSNEGAMFNQAKMGGVPPQSK